MWSVCRVQTLLVDMAAARREMFAVGVPVLPWSFEDVSDPVKAKAVAREIGYPAILQTSGGGESIGMTIAGGEDELSKALESAQAVAKNAFGIGDVYLERYLSDPRHIEFQIVADSQGNVVHLGERECSIQRRHQKLIEESPSPALDAEARNRMGDVAVAAARSVGGRIRDVAGAAESLAGGSLESRVPVRGEDEVASLAGSFNLMAGRLQETMASVEAERARAVPLLDANRPLLGRIDAIAMARIKRRLELILGLCQIDHKGKLWLDLTDLLRAECLQILSRHITHRLDSHEVGVLILASEQHRAQRLSWILGD